MHTVFYRFVLTLIKQPSALPALLIFMSVWSTSYSQPTQRTDTVQLNVEKDLASQLLPFEDIYELALSHSPLIKQQTADIDGKVAAAQALKWSFLNGVALSTAVTRGNQSVITNDNAAYPMLSLSNGYRLGVNANISIGELLNRRPHIKQAQSDHRSALARRDVMTQELRRDLYRIYQAALLSHRLLQFYIQGEQVALVAFQTAEISWKENRLAAVDYSGASRLYMETQAKVEGERITVSLNLFDLVTLTGVPLAQLQRLSK